MATEHEQLRELHRTPQYVDDVLKEELGHMYIGIPGFFEAFFREVAGLKQAAQAVFEKCKEGDNPLYREESG